MKKLLLLTSMALLFLSFNGKSQCTVSVDGGASMNLENHHIAQSVTAECDGYLSYIKIHFDVATVDTLYADTLMLYYGNNTTTPVYKQAFSKKTIEAGTTTRFSLSGFFKIANNETYTFGLNSNLDIQGKAEDYYSGGNLIVDGTAVPGSDMDFEFKINADAPDINGCEFEFVDGTGIGHGGHTIAQSFVPECNGYLKYIYMNFDVATTDTLRGDTLRLYYGNNTDEPYFEKAFSDVEVIEGTPTRFRVFNDYFKVVAGEPITFEYKSNLDVVGKTSDTYPWGNLFVDGVVQSDSDLDFKITVSENPYNDIGCEYGLDGKTGIGFADSRVAQSFNAECNGYLKGIDLFFDVSTTETLIGDTLRIYSGEGADNLIYEDIYEDMDAVPGEAVHFDIPGYVKIAAGENYTFEYYSNLDLYGRNDNFYLWGDLYVDGVIETTYDAAFSILINDSPPEILGCDINVLGGSSVGSDFTFGQSFTAECDGYLDYIQLYHYKAYDGKADTLLPGMLTLYNGNQVENAALEQAFDTIIVESEGVIRIYLDGFFKVAAGEQYTFELFSTVHLKVQAGDPYYWGSFFYNKWEYTTYDLAFTAGVKDTPPQILGCDINVLGGSSVGSDFTIGQSFTAECDGYLDYIQLYHYKAYDGKADTLLPGMLTLYNGNQVENAALEQAFDTIIVESEGVIRIYLDGFFKVAAGEQYTFELFSTVHLKVQAGDPYYWGSFFYNKWEYTTYDLAFTASINKNIPQLYGCNVGFSEGTSYDFEDHTIGQSFISECNGYLDYVMYYHAGTETDTLKAETLRLYKGNSTENAVYEEAFEQIIVDPGDSVRINLNSLFIVKSGEQYTFEFLTSVDVKAQEGNVYYWGNAFYDGIAYENHDAAFYVNITDTTRFTDYELTCHGDTTVSADLNMCSYTVLTTDFDATYTHYQVSVTTLVNNFTNTESLKDAVLPFGETNIMWTLTDEDGYRDSCIMKVTVLDEQIPILTCHADTSTNVDAGVNYYTIVGSLFDPIDLEDNCTAVGDLVVTNDFNDAATLAGEELPLDTTIIIWTITDESGNSSNCSTQIVVTDAEAPSMVCHNDTSFQAEGEFYTVTDSLLDPTNLSDNCTAVENLVLTNDFNDSGTLYGAVLPKGITTIKWTLTDEAGNVFECEFDVDIYVGVGDDPFDVTRIYPNPTEGFVQVDFNQSINPSVWNIQVLNALGKNVIIQNTEILNSSVILDVQGLEKGIYFIRVDNGKQVRAYKIIKN